MEPSFSNKENKTIDTLESDMCSLPYSHLPQTIAEPNKSNSNSGAFGASFKFLSQQLDDSFSNPFHSCARVSKLWLLGTASGSQVKLKFATFSIVSTYCEYYSCVRAVFCAREFVLSVSLYALTVSRCPALLAQEKSVVVTSLYQNFT